LEKSLLIAVGGNSLMRAGERGTVAQQFANARLTAEAVASLAARGYHIVITHGNGPQVGAQLLRSEIASSQTYALPLDICVAMTQGEIGYVLENSLHSALNRLGLRTPIAVMITKVLVHKDDPAFKRPTKPIGPFYSREVAERKKAELGWDVVEDASRGFRQVVPSPKPFGIVGLEVIRECLEKEFIVIAAGGGGIPVLGDGSSIQGVEAVVDKDWVSGLLAKELQIERMAISTDVEYVCLNYKKPEQEAISRMTVQAAKGYLAQGHFAEGSMKPKIEMAIDFLEARGHEVIITDPQHLVDAVEGNAGTRITNEDLP
jgi:carbamate kinase